VKANTCNDSDTIFSPRPRLKPRVILIGQEIAPHRFFSSALHHSTVLHSTIKAPEGCKRPDLRAQYDQYWFLMGLYLQTNTWPQSDKVSLI